MPFLHRDSIIVADFDGTITQQDTNVELLQTFGCRENEFIEEQYINGSMGTKEAMEKHFQLLTINKKTYIQFVQAKIQIAPGFTDFYHKLRNLGIDFAVVSGGYAEAIETVFSREGLVLPQIYANRLKFADGEIKSVFFHKEVLCPKSFGPCGNCKASHIRHWQQQNKTVIFIGDGLTDRCAAESADYVFAKESLAGYCNQKGIPFREFQSFIDINHVLFG